MTHIQKSTFYKNWSRSFIDAVAKNKTQLMDFVSDPNNISVIETSSNHYITTREANALSKYVQRTADEISIGAIGGGTRYFILKRAIDLVVAVSLLALMFPFLVLCAIWVAIENSGVVLSKQQNYTSKLVKKDGQYVWTVVPFVKYQFLTSDQTASGQFLQSTGLVNLPTLLNVLRGEMSIVGTDMLIDEEIEALEDWQLLSLACKPGIIALSYISGKVSWLTNDNTRQEIWYACNQSISIDTQILVKAFQKTMMII